MTTNRTKVDQHPKSDYVREAEELLARRLAATTTHERRALEIQLGALLAAHRVRSAWDAARDAEAVKQASGVSRDTSHDPVCHGQPATEHAVRDRKLESVGPESE